MPMMTLIFAAAAALVNLWLAIRCGRVRAKEGINHGDGGNGLLARRMRAQLNFAENAPVVLVLVLALELAGANAMALHILAAVFIIARILHALGMDSENSNWMRGAGVGLTMLVTLILVGLALYTGYAMMAGATMPAPAAMPA